MALLVLRDEEGRLYRDPEGEEKAETKAVRREAVYQPACHRFRLMHIRSEHLKVMEGRIKRMEALLESSRAALNRLPRPPDEEEEEKEDDEERSPNSEDEEERDESLVEGMTAMVLGDRGISRFYGMA